MNFTIFTPTYNREKELDRLYLSLLNLKYKNFEWIIVDDGSIDSTKNKIDGYIKENKINIIYIYQENGGKHRAINKGLKFAKGKYFFIVDSDDWLPEESLNIINKYVENIKFNIVGVCGLKANSINEIVGTKSKKEIVIYNYEREKYGISGDKAEVYLTEFLKKYKFPDIDGEKFISEALVWNKIGLEGYKLLYFNEIIYYCEYLNNGLSNNLNNNYKNSPKGTTLYIKQLILINKKNIFNRLKYISFYYKVFKKIYSKKEICKKLNITMIEINLSIFIRNLLRKG